MNFITIIKALKQAGQITDYGSEATPYLKRLRRAGCIEVAVNESCQAGGIVYKIWKKHIPPAQIVEPSPEAPAMPQIARFAAISLGTRVLWRDGIKHVSERYSHAIYPVVDVSPEWVTIQGMHGLQRLRPANVRMVDAVKEVAA